MRATVPVKSWPYEAITRQDILKAARLYDQGATEPGFGPSRDWEVVIGQRAYSPKVILAIAHRLATGEPLEWHYGGWGNLPWYKPRRDTDRANPFLLSHGFRIIRKGEKISKRPSRRARLRRAATRFEGIERAVMRSIRSRSAAARAECIAIHGTRCTCCLMRLSDVYGQIAKDYVQVHHRRPLHKTRGRRVVDPKADLCPVCPNCHIVLHLRKPEFSVEELRELIERRRNRNDR